MGLGIYHGVQHSCSPMAWHDIPGQRHSVSRQFSKDHKPHYVQEQKKQERRRNKAYFTNYGFVYVKGHVVTQDDSQLANVFTFTCIFIYTH